jgi:hypothetical protein
MISDFFIIQQAAARQRDPFGKEPIEETDHILEPEASGTMKAARPYPHPRMQVRPKLHRLSLLPLDPDLILK